MVMAETSRATPYSVVSEFEGTILKNKEVFSYFMLLAFDASGLIRFIILLCLWPIIALLNVLSYKNTSLKLMIFVATVGLREQEIVSAARLVLPKFYMDDLSMHTWRVFSSCKKRVVVTKMPRVMVERFAKEHLRADDVIGTELTVNGLGFFTGLIRENDIDQSITNSLRNLFVDRRPHLGLGRPDSTTTFLSLCEEQVHEPVHWNSRNQQFEVQLPKQVIFHDGWLVKRPTPATALLILIWFPFGILLGTIRILVGYFLPMWALPYIIGILGCRVIVKGTPPPAGNSGGVLFACNHRTLLDPFLVPYALKRNIPIVVSYKISRLFHILSPIPLVTFTRIRDVDASRMKQELSKGDLVICPEGCTCCQPFVLRFSSMFAELTDKIVPVAINCRAGFFISRVRSWNRLQCAMFICMNPMVVYEITFLNQLPLEATCSSGRSPYDVANHVQRILADTLEFECTNLKTKDWYELVC